MGRLRDKDRSLYDIDRIDPILGVAQRLKSRTLDKRGGYTPENTQLIHRSENRRKGATEDKARWKQIKGS